MSTAPTVNGFRVVALPPNGYGRGRALSRVFTVRAAAEAYAELARRTGHSTATVETVRGFDEAGGLCHE